MENKENSTPNIDENIVQLQELLRTVKNEELHHEEATPAINTGYESLDAIHPLMMQSMAILEGAEGAFEFDANTGTPQDFQPATQGDSQHQPTQLTGLQASSSYSQQLQQTSLLPAQILSNSPVYQVPSHQTEHQQQELQSTPWFPSSRQAETLQPTVQAASLQHPSSEQPDIISYILSSQPYLSIRPPVATTGFYCTICSTSFDTNDQLEQHALKYLGGGGVKVFICWCGKLIPHFPNIISHLQQHTETSLCALCGEDLLTLHYLHEHFDLHLKAGYLRCNLENCKMIFLDEKSRLRHQRKKHPATETKGGSRPTQKRQSQQRDAIAVKIAREEIDATLKAFTLQSPTVIPSGAAFPFGTVTENATLNTATATQFQPPAEPHSQNKPPVDQVASSQTTSSYPQQLPHTCSTIKQKQQPSPPRFISSQQPETLQPVEFLQEPSLEQRVVVAPDTPAASQPVQPTPSPLPDTSTFDCRICSLHFADKHQLIQHAMNHDGPKIFLCHLCGEFSVDLPAAACHCCSI